MTRTITVSLLFAVAVLAAGCAVEPVDVGEVALLAGGAADDGTGFVAHEHGDEVLLVAGAQGGFHVWINFEITGAMGKHYIEREARRSSDDALILRATRQVIEIPENAMSDWWQRPDASASFMCPAPLGIQVFDDEVEFTVRLVNDDDELVAEDRLVLLPRCPDGDQLEFCHRICSG